VLEVGGVGVHDVDVLGVDGLQCRPVAGRRRRRRDAGAVRHSVVAVPRPLTRTDAAAADRVVASLQVAVRRVLGST